MSFLKKLVKSVKKVGTFIEDKVLEPVAKDVIPMGAAYFTGGQSLSVLPPSNSGLTSSITDSLLGVKAGDLTSGIMGGIMGGGSQPQQQSEQARTEYVTAQVSTPVVQQQAMQNRNVASVNSTSDLASSPQVGNNAPQLAPKGINTQTMMMIGGGVGLLALVLMMGKKK